MYFHQFYLGCLAHASYLVGADGEAAVVDPQRDVEQYLHAAAAHGYQIKYVIETHLHADFVSGHRELAARTGADIVSGHKAGAIFLHRAVHDGDELTLGTVTLRFLETPGHTPESIAVLVIDRTVSDQPQKVLTGDTLFIGDVGRPDLVGSKGYTAKQMAEMLYDSLHDKLLTLDDRVEVYPAHGAGSMCWCNIGQETSSSAGRVPGAMLATPWRRHRRPRHRGSERSCTVCRRLHAELCDAIFQRWGELVHVYYGSMRSPLHDRTRQIGTLCFRLCVPVPCTTPCPA